MARTLSTLRAQAAHGCARFSVGRRGGRCCAAAAWAAVIIACLAPAVRAQEYQADQPDDKAFKLKVVADGCVKDPAKYAASSDQFNEFFSKYYFPAMTQFGPEDLAKLGKLRSDLFSFYLWPAQSEDLQKNLTAMALAAMKPIAGKPTYHPSVRYNAILVIGLLDDKYAVVGGGSPRPPVPSKDADKFLLQVLEANEKGRPVPPSLVVGAVIGLERHAQFHDSLDPAQIDAMTNAAVKLATSDTPVPDVDNKVAEWVRLEAATLLARLGTVGTDNHAHDALVKVLSDNKLSIDGRCDVAGMLAMINYKDAKVDGKAATAALFQLTSDVGQAEDKRAKDYQELSLAGGGGMMTRGGPRGMREGAGGYGASGDQHSDYDRKTLLSRLTDLKKGLVAIKPVAPADRAAAIDAISAGIQKVIDAASKTDTTDLDVADAVRKLYETIQSASGGNSATAAAKPAAEPF
jgi:hypothetical protein